MVYVLTLLGVYEMNSPRYAPAGLLVKCGSTRLMAAFINGLAVLLSVYRPSAGEKWVGNFRFGFLCALMLGVYLAWSILLTKRG